VGDGFKPPPSARAAADHGLELRRKWGRGGTAVGVARARDLSNGAEVSRETVGRMAAFARHLGQPEADPPDGGPSARAIAIKLWGGAGAINWAKAKMDAIRRLKKGD
jgi:hypothetical protein